MPYIGKHMNIVDVCETLLEILDEELDISSVEIPEHKAENAKRISRREKVRLARRIMAKISPFTIVPLRVSPLVYGGISPCMV